MLVYVVVSAETEHAVELFVRREEAEMFLDEVRADDEELAATLRLEPVELDALRAAGAARVGDARGISTSRANVVATLMSDLHDPASPAIRPPRE